MNNSAGNEQQASRGSSVLVDNIRWQGYLTKLSDDALKNISMTEIERKYYVLFGVSKQNYGFPVSDIVLKKISSANKDVNGYCLKVFDIDHFVTTNKKGGKNGYNG